MDNRTAKANAVMLGAAQAILSGFLFMKELKSTGTKKQMDAFFKFIEYELIFAPNFLIFLKWTKSAQAIGTLIVVDLAFNGIGAAFQFIRASQMPQAASPALQGASP